jgi:hypothetical protein
MVIFALLLLYYGFTQAFQLIDANPIDEHVG